MCNLKSFKEMVKKMHKYQTMFYNLSSLRFFIQTSFSVCTTLRGLDFFTVCLSVYKTSREKPERLKARISSLAFNPQCAFIIHFSTIKLNPNV